jgi:very-short-patch-repair endonuclease
LSKEWHPTKNGNLKPTDVTIGTGRKVWWICPLGHEYQASVMHRGHGTACPICNSGRQTSFSEQALFFYIRQIFPDSISRYKFDSSERLEVDIYIPSIGLAIEYDGEFWHKSEKARNTDARKYSLLLKNGIRLWRIREDFSQSEILVTQSFSGKAVDFSDIKAEYIFYYNPGNKYKNLDFLIKNVLYLVNPNTNPWLMRTFPKKSDFVDVDTKRDIFEIKKYINPINN